MSQHLRYAGLPDAQQIEIAKEILSTHEALMTRLGTLAQSALPDAWIVSSALYGNIWNALTGQPWDHGVKDYDIFYFDDTDLSYEAEDAVIRTLTPQFPAQPPVEFRNQARVHLWYETHFGTPYSPLKNSRDGITRFACTTHMIGARLLNGELNLYAPKGLEPIFAFQLIGNTERDNRATHEAKGARHTKTWPDLTFIPWETSL